MILDRYLGLHFFKAAGIAGLLLISLFSFLSFAEALEDVGQGRFTTTDAIAVVLLTLPARVIDLLPVTMLLGSVLGLGILANHHELAAMRAAGLSAWRLARTLAVIATVLALSALAIQSIVIPAAERKAQEFRTRTLEQTALGGTEFWSRRDRDVVRVGEVAFGRIPHDIEIYELDQDMHVVRLLRASRADIVSAHAWVLHDVEERVIDGEQVFGRTLTRLDWSSFLSPDQLATLVSPAHALSPLDLYRYLRETSGSGIDTLEHETRFWHQLSLPFTVFGMTLLGLPLVAASVRARSGGFRALVGAAVGIGFYLFEQITGQLSLLFEVEPALTAFAPATLVLTAALLGIRRLA